MPDEINVPLIIDCSNAVEYQDLVKHCWIGFESITIGGLMRINRVTCGDTLDVLLGLIDAGINLLNSIDWTVRAVITDSSKPPRLVKEGDRYKVVFEPDGCVALILQVQDAKGGLVTYLTPRDLDRFGQATWVPAWRLSGVAATP